MQISFANAYYIFLSSDMFISMHAPPVGPAVEPPVDEAVEGDHAHCEFLNF